MAQKNFEPLIALSSVPVLPEGIANAGVIQKLSSNSGRG